MVKMEPIMKIWYDSLRDEGAIKGLKCNECGTVQFPPVPVCGRCSGMETEWTQIDGEGELISVSYSPMGVPPYYHMPSVTGYGRLKEGMLFSSVLLDVDEAKQQELIERLKKREKIRFKLEVTKLDDIISFPNLLLID
jgi:uncharacterized OB-fold protein